MARPMQADNSLGYPSMVAGAIELDIEAVSILRHLPFCNNSDELKYPKNRYYLLWQLQEPSSLFRNPDIIRNP